MMTFKNTKYCIISILGLAMISMIITVPTSYAEKSQDYKDGYSDGYNEKSQQPDRGFDYNLGYKDGSTDRLTGKPQKYISTDWNNGGKGAPDGGDPLLFSLTNKAVHVIRNWPEQHESFLTEFDLYDIGEKVTLSRTLDEGTMTLFLDLDGDGELSDGTEWLFDQDEDVYQILKRSMIDSNQNGWFDYSDKLWSVAMIKNGDEYFPASELGIIGFNWSDAEHYNDDDIGSGRYSDCLYEGVFLYPDCKPVSTEHFRIKAYNPNGILLEGGKIIPTFGGVMGWIEK